MKDKTKEQSFADFVRDNDKEDAEQAINAMWVIVIVGQFMVRIGACVIIGLAFGVGYGIAAYFVEWLVILVVALGTIDKLKEVVREVWG